jgi:hypothetical protein
MTQPQYLSHSRDCRKPTNVTVVIANSQHLLQKHVRRMQPSTAVGTTSWDMPRGCSLLRFCASVMPSIRCSTRCSTWAWYQAGAHTHAQFPHRATIMHSIETRSLYIVLLGSNVTNCNGNCKDRLHKTTARERQLQKTIAQDYST